MHPTAANIGYTVLIAAFVLFILYRRFRRTFGRQKLRPTRMMIRIVILAAVCVLALASPFRSLSSDLAAAGGAVIGIALGAWAFAHTRFESTADGRFYTPNGYIGMLVVALFLGRLIYRFIVIYPLMHHAVQQAAQNPQVQADPFGSFQYSPMTVGLYFLLTGYYICYYVGILIKGRKLVQADNSNKPKLIS